MLVLARRLNERIVIPCIQTAIQIVGIQGGMIRLGFEAPADVKVFREEVVTGGRTERATTDRPSARDGAGPRLSDAAREITSLRLRLRGQLPAAAAATLFRIDQELSELAQRLDRDSGTRYEAAPATEVAVAGTR